MAILVIIFTVYAIKKLSKSSTGNYNPSDQPRDVGTTSSGKSGRINYEDSTTKEPFYIFYSILAPYFNDFDNVTKSNAEAFPELYQIAYCIFDRNEKLIEEKLLNIEYIEIPRGLKYNMKESEQELKENSQNVVDALKKFSADCEKAQVFVTHAEFHHRNILFANYYKQGLELPFQKSSSIDIMEKAKKWVDIRRDNGRGLKNPSFKECLGMALANDPYAAENNEFSTEEKTFCLPYIYFKWKRENKDL